MADAQTPSPFTLSEDERSQLVELLDALDRETQAIRDQLAGEAGGPLTAMLIYELDGRAHELVEFLNESGVADRAAGLRPD